MTSLREKWSAGDETLGLWLSVPGFVGAEIVALETVDFVCVDMQHGVNDYPSASIMIQAIDLVGGNPIVRVPWNEPGIIGKSLDAGAQGVIVPMVNTREQAEAMVRSMRYAPEGSRSWGPMMVGMRHADNRAWAAENIAVIPMIETAEAVGNLDDILSVPGVDAIYVGPADLSLSLGSSPFYSEDDPVFTEALEKIVAACNRHGVVPGIHATGPLTPRRRQQGFRMITVTGDALALRSGYGSELAAARQTEAAKADGSLY